MTEKIDWKLMFSKVYPWLISGALFLFYTHLFYAEKFGVKSYMFMLCFNTLFLFGLLGFPRLKEFHGRDLKLVLAEIKEKEAEIYATEKQLREMAVYIGEVLAFLSLIAGRMGNREQYELRRDWVTAKLKQLKRKAKIDLKNVDIYTELYGEVDELVPDASLTTNPKYAEAKARLAELSKQLEERMKKDIEEISHEQD